MDKQETSTVVGTQTQGLSVYNIGIGMLIGLLIALVVAFFAMGEGPFKDKANKNSLTAQQGSTDPNSSLYGNNVAPVGLPSNAAPGNEQGAGASVLMGGAKNTLASDAANAAKSKTSAATDAANNDQIADLLNGDAQGAALNAPKAVTPAAATSGAKGKFVIQAGAFNDAEKAQALKDSLVGQGQKATVTKKQTADGETVYRVRVGGYASAQDAQSDNKKIKGVVLDAGN